MAYYGGNLYVANSISATSGSISKVTSSGVVSTFIGSGLRLPDGLAFDKTGNLYVANGNTNTVSEFNSSGSLINASFGGTSSFNTPQGLAFDSSGNLYVANGSSSTISKVTPSGSTSTFATMPSGSGPFAPIPFGLAFDSNGNLYVTNGVPINSSIVEFSSTGALINSNYAMGFAFGQPNYIAFGPTPEPSSLALLGTVAATLTLGWRRRKARGAAEVL